MRLGVVLQGEGNCHHQLRFLIIGNHVGSIKVLPRFPNTGLTTIAGFASLILAHHRGLSSFGFVISVGVLANLVVSLFILPAVVRVVRGRGRGRKGDVAG